MSIVETLIGQRAYEAKLERLGGRRILITTDIYEPPQSETPLLIEPECFESVDSARAQLEFRKLVNLTTTFFSAAISSTIIAGVMSEVGKEKSVGVQDLVFLAIGGLALRFALDRVLEAKKADTALKILEE